MSYRDAQALYLEAGWTAPLPLPARAKYPPPEGTTGREAPMPDPAMLKAWLNGHYPDGNLALRLPVGVLGIDVDAHDDKPGAATLATLEARLGPLPPTYSSSARSWPSGIRLYRVPDGPPRAWRDPGPGIEVIHYGWRYAVAWPSIHPNGSAYGWRGPDGQVARSLPRLDDLSLLPDAWVTYLDTGELTARVEVDVIEPEWLAMMSRPPYSGSCRIMRDSTARHVGNLRAGSSRHDDMLRGVQAVVGLAVDGHKGIGQGLAELRKAFLEVTTDRSTWGEWDRALSGAIRKVGASTLLASPPCRCDEPATARPDAQPAHAEDEASGRRVVLTMASDISTRRVTWLWDGRLALGILALMAGREGLGKSSFCYWLAACVTRGLLPGEYHGRPRAVLVCATEDSWEHTIVPRLIATGADLGRVYRVEVKHEDIVTGLTLPRDNAEVEAVAQRVGAALLLLDPIMSRISTQLNTNIDPEVRQALEPMTASADRAGLTVLGIIHLNKTASVDILDRVMGSKAFAAVARAVCAVVPDPDDSTHRTRLFGVPKNNLGRDDLPSLRFTIEGTVIHTDDGGVSEVGRVVLGAETETTIKEAMERNSEDDDTRTQIGEAKAWLLEYLTEHDHSLSADIKQAAAAAGLSVKALDRARKALGVMSVNLSVAPRRTTWSLPLRPSRARGEMG